MAHDNHFEIRTYGCQMNVHDSQKISNLLLHAGFGASTGEDQTDLLIINTCSIREKAENQLYSDLGALRDWKEAQPGRVLGVGGCVAQQVGDAILKRFAHVDFVFGTHNLRLVPAMTAAAREGQRSSRTEESRSLERFDLPESHAAAEAPTRRSAYVTAMEGCDMFCSFCIVPTTRGREISRPAAAIVSEVEGLVERGVREITLLGQTVNAYGRHDQRQGKGAAAGTVSFAELLRDLDTISGLERIRYTSPHPLFFDADLVACHAQLESLCPHVHLPLQSGSNGTLERMRRRYSRERFLEIAGALSTSRPDLVLTTDVIVGFPGELERDFEQTLEVMSEVGFVDSYSFKYSPRPGTAAADMPEPVSPAVAQERLETLQLAQRARTIAYHRTRVGQRAEILVEGASRRPGQVRGRDPYNRVVNLDVQAGFDPQPGDLLIVDIVEATPHSLIGQPVERPLKDTEIGPRPARDPLAVVSADARELT